MASDQSLIIIIGFLSIFSLLLWKITYNLFISPLKKIPGPFFAKFTTKWLTINEVLGNRSLVIEQAHQKYGPVIRIAPDELSFSEQSCIKELYYQASKFPKSRRYEGFASTTRASFDMTDIDQHRERRHLVRHVLSKSNIDDAEPLIGKQVRKALDWAGNAEAEGQSLEVMLWARRMMLDTAGALFLGKEFGALDTEKQPEFLDDMDAFFNITALRWLAPWILTVLRSLPIPAVRHFLGAQERGYQYGRNAFDKYINRYGRFSGRIDLLTKMVGTKESQPLSDEQISNELGSLLVGATDTTVVVLTWLLWELAQRPEWQEKIRKELRQHNIDFATGITAYRQISELPALNGFVTESMRLHPAQSIGLPRVARFEGEVIGGVEVPAGTYVSIQSRNIHRNPAIFPSPTSFSPERWISTNGGTQQMKEAFIIWSKGSRACLGQYVATMEIKLIIASLMNQWNMSIGPETTRETMAQTDYFLAFPKMRECWLRFERAQ